MSMPDLVADVVEFIGSEREPCKPSDVAMELFRLGTNCKLWPESSVTQWMDAIEEAVKRGLLDKSERGVKRPTVSAEAKPKQLGLFDD
jgi:hypothetical protein